MKQTPHVVAAAAAMLLSFAAAVAFNIYAQRTEQKYVHAVAAQDHSELSGGSAIERVALRQPDLLLIFGASELVLLDTKYDATRLFSTYPTGFMVFNAATKGGSSLNIAQDLAALGPELRGKRVILAIGPGIMATAAFGDVGHQNYDLNFSELHALEMTYSPYVTGSTKRIAAVRMLAFPETLADKPFLSFTLRNMVEDSFASRIQYVAGWPLAQLQLAIMRLQDHYATVTFIHHLSKKQLRVVRRPAQIDWQALVQVAEQEQNSKFRQQRLRRGQHAVAQVEGMVRGVLSAWIKRRRVHLRRHHRQGMGRFEDCLGGHA